MKPISLIGLLVGVQFAAGCGVNLFPDLRPYPMPRPSVSSESTTTPEGCWIMATGLNAVGNYLAIEKNSQGGFVIDQSADLSFGDGYFADNGTVYSIGDSGVYVGNWASYPSALLIPRIPIEGASLPVLFFVSQDGENMTFGLPGALGRLYVRIDCSTLP